MNASLANSRLPIRLEMNRAIESYSKGRPGKYSLGRRKFRMPFRNEKQFTTANIQEMTAAYDSVVAKLKLKPNDPRREKLATLIVQLAKADVVDAERLADQARAGLK